MLVGIVLALVIAACGGDNDGAPTLVIGGIPDQDVSLLEERFGGVAEYLSGELGFDVEYRPSVDYAALVTAFKNGDVGLAWFGGLTGVQARLATPGATAIAQRPRDQEFHSVFIVGEGVDVETLADLRGKSFTFGSESSTSGHLMPRFFLTEAGIDPEADFDRAPSYSGSHDKTWKFVEAGAFEAGALNEAVWQRAVEEGSVDLSKVRLLERTPAYFDYHWVAGPGLDGTYGDGTVAKIAAAMLAMDGGDPDQARVLELFQTDQFIATNNDNYAAIETTARSLGLIQ